MAAYIPVIVWLISAAICYAIAKKKKLRPTMWWDLLVVFLGPFAIPIIIFAHPGKTGDSSSHI